MDSKKMFWEICSVLFAFGVGYLIYWGISSYFKKKPVEDVPLSASKENQHTVTRWVNGTKKTMTERIATGVEKYEKHQEELLKEKQNEFMENVKIRLRGVPSPAEGRNIAVIILQIVEEIYTVYDHREVQHGYVLGILTFVDRAIFSNDVLYVKKLGLGSFTCIPELADNSWLLLASYLQSEFNFSEKLKIKKRCCCGRHPGMYWPMIKAILFNEPETKKVVRWRDMNFVDAADVK